MDHLAPIALLFFLVFLPVAAVFYPIWALRRKRRYSPLVENRLRLPGESTRVTLLDIGFDIIPVYFGMYGVILVVALTKSFLFTNPLAKIVVVLLGVVLLGWFAFLINKKMRRAFNYRIGAEGEEYTGQELNLLARDGAYVFHDIPYKYGNIDHIVVGYDKIFVIETKAVRKPGNSNGNKEAAVRYDGSHLHFPHFKVDKPLKQAEMHREYISRLLSEFDGFTIPVVPVVALPGWYVEPGNTSSVLVQVINPKRGNFLRRQIGARKQCEQFTFAVKKIETLARHDAPTASITDPDAGEYYNLWTNERKV